LKTLEEAFAIREVQGRSVSEHFLGHPQGLFRPKDNQNASEALFRIIDTKLIINLFHLSEQFLSNQLILEQMFYQVFINECNLIFSIVREQLSS
jgi:hypothetical protein